MGNRIKTVVCEGSGDWLREHVEHGEAQVEVEGKAVTITCPCGETFQGEAVIVYDQGDPGRPSA